MKAESIQAIKQELNSISNKELVELCLRLARFKKENKELLTYLLFEAHDNAAYIESVKVVIDQLFETINPQQVYFIKKSLRKILRTIARYTKYSNDNVVEVELIIHFCNKMAALKLLNPKYAVLVKIYQLQIVKLSKIIAQLHEDLQYDYVKQLELLKSASNV